MGTRCMIKLGDSGVALYCHWDGYPESVIADAWAAIRKDNIRTLTSDPKYAAARFVQRFINNTSPDGELGFGLCSSDQSEMHGDLEYSYLLTNLPDGRWVMYWLSVGLSPRYPTANDHHGGEIMPEAAK